jgi:hypothetical protein
LKGERQALPSNVDLLAPIPSSISLTKFNDQLIATNSSEPAQKKQKFDSTDKLQSSTEKPSGSVIKNIFI